MMSLDEQHVHVIIQVNIEAQLVDVVLKWKRLVFEEYEVYLLLSHMLWRGCWLVIWFGCKSMTWMCVCTWIVCVKIIFYISCCPRLLVWRFWENWCVISWVFGSSVFHLRWIGWNLDFWIWLTASREERQWCVGSIFKSWKFITYVYISPSWWSLCKHPPT